MPISIRQFFAFAALFFSSSIFAPAWAEDPLRISIEVIGPWARASTSLNRPTAAYLTLRNIGTEEDRLIAVESPSAGRAEIHETVVMDGVSHMHPAAALPLPPGADLVLKPGGLHIMLMDLKSPLVNGQVVKVILQFAISGPMEVWMPVMPAGAQGLPTE